MKRSKSLTTILSILIVGFVVFGGMVLAWSTAVDLFKPAGSSTTPINIVITPGETLAQIGDDLQRKGLIRSAFAFDVWARMKGLDLQAGLYKNLKPSMSIMQIADDLLNERPTDPNVVRYTIREGYRLEQIASFLDDKRLVNFKKDDFLNYTQHPDQFPDKAKYPLLQQLPGDHGMEGLLFATTYDIPVRSTAQDVINQMLRQTETLLTQNNLEQLAKQYQYKNVYELINLASIVERETAKKEDGPKIASVYWNRIFKPNDETVGLLNADPTLQYIRDTNNPPDRYWQPLDDDPANILPDSLYNTYNNPGLPPTPICSPSLDSLLAAATPANTDYYYFFASTDGNDYFAPDLATFERLKAEHPVKN
jgi:UPF0755 protein